MFFLSIFTVDLSLLPSYVKLETSTNAKMNDRVLKERMGTSRLNDVFLKIYPYDPTSKFQKLAISSGLTFMQSKIKI